MATVYSQTKLPTVAANTSRTNGTAWASPSNALLNDGQTTSHVVLSGGAYSDYLDLSAFGFALPSGSTVVGYEVIIERWGSTTDQVFDNTVVLKSGSTTSSELADANRWPDTGGAWLYGGESELCGLTLTSNQVNDDAFTLRIAATAATDNMTAYIDHARVTVYYTLADASTLITLAEYDTYSPNSMATDAQKLAAIASATAQIESICGRTFNAKTHYDWIHIGSVDQYHDTDEAMWMPGAHQSPYPPRATATNAVSLSEYPLVRLLRVATGEKQVASITFANTSGVSAQASIANGILTLSDVTPGSARLGYADFTLANYSSLSVLATAISANTDINTGWTLAVVSEEKPASLKPIATDNALNTSVELVGPSDPGRANVDYLSGLITLPSPMIGWVYCEYRAGYEIVPADIKQLCLEMTAELIDMSSIQGGLSQLRIGDTTEVYSTGDIAEKYAMRLSAYKRRSL